MKRSSRRFNRQLQGIQKRSTSYGNTFTVELLKKQRLRYDGNDPLGTPWEWRLGNAWACLGQSLCCWILWAGTEECLSLRVYKVWKFLLTIKQLQLPPLLQRCHAGWSCLRRCSASPKQQVLNLTWNLGKTSPEKPKALNPADIWPGTRRLAQKNTAITNVLIENVQIKYMVIPLLEKYWFLLAESFSVEPSGRRYLCI